MAYLIECKWKKHNFINSFLLVMSSLVQECGLSWLSAIQRRHLSLSEVMPTSFNQSLQLFPQIPKIYLRNLSWTFSMNLMSPSNHALHANDANSSHSLTNMLKKVFSMERSEDLTHCDVCHFCYLTAVLGQLHPNINCYSCLFILWFSLVLASSWFFIFYQNVVSCCWVLHPFCQVEDDVLYFSSVLLRFHGLRHLIKFPHQYSKQWQHQYHLVDIIDGKAVAGIHLRDISTLT